MNVQSPDIKLFMRILRQAESDKLIPKHWEVSPKFGAEAINDAEFLAHATIENGKLTTILSLPVYDESRTDWEVDRFDAPYQLIAQFPDSRSIAISLRLDADPNQPFSSIAI